MSTTISLTYLPGVAQSDSPGWITTSEIFRRAAAVTHTHAFQMALETIAVLSIFASLTIWAFAVSPSLSSL
jgi:hypothetical protein